MKNTYEVAKEASSYVFQNFQNGFNYFTFKFFNGQSMTGLLWKQESLAQEKKIFVTLRNPANLKETSFDMEDVTFIQAVA